jgi:kynureninase
VGAAAGELVVADSTSVNLFKVLSAALSIARADAPQRRKVLSERTYVLFGRDGARIAGRLDITPLPPGFSDVRFLGGGRN